MCSVRAVRTLAAMITRKTLGGLAILTLVLFGIAAIVGQHQHGFVQAIGDVAWNGFILCLLLLVVASLVVLVRSWRVRRA
jgi:hypothetical protein